MASIASLTRQIESVTKDIESMENNNDGSIRWVEELRELIILKDELEMQLAQEENNLDFVHNLQEQGYDEAEIEELI